MASIIGDYSYDVFISYRQRDNKYDSWVTEFVDNLKKELESTFKEEISVYFDINPHDGLLESHDVDASLKEKLKCLVFIPILSRTYCDQKSFAWNNEFKAFIKQASDDRFGLKVKLPGGNVASRVLPVQIHELDADDKSLIEAELGGVLRSIEFIYREPGVNRPLVPQDDETRNLNRTKYRNQINKVANAVKEISAGLSMKDSQQSSVSGGKSQGSISAPESGYHSRRTKRARVIQGLIPIIILLITVMVLLYPKLFNKDSLRNLRDPEGRITIVVMPFANATNNESLNSWQLGLQFNMINYLAGFPDEFIVRDVETMNRYLYQKGYTNYAKLTPSSLSFLSKKIDAGVFISGNITQSGSRIRVNAELYRADNAENIFPLYIVSSPDSLFEVADHLSQEVRNFMAISKRKKKLQPYIRPFLNTRSLEAMDNFVKGNMAQIGEELDEAASFYKLAIKADSDFVYPYLRIILMSIESDPARAKEFNTIIYKKRDSMTEQLRLLTEYVHCMTYNEPEKAVPVLEQLKRVDDQFPMSYFYLGVVYYVLQKYDNSVQELQKSLEVYDKWGVKPYKWLYFYLSDGLRKTSQPEEATRILKRAVQDNPGDVLFAYSRATIAIAEGDTASASIFIKQIFNDYAKGDITREAEIYREMAIIYMEEGYIKKAEEYFRKSYNLIPLNAYYVNNLAWFLFWGSNNVIEGMEIIEKGLRRYPKSPWLMDTKAIGLYKLGRYKEALDLLEEADRLGTDDSIKAHIVMVRKALDTGN